MNTISEACESPIVFLRRLGIRYAEDIDSLLPQGEQEMTSNSTARSFDDLRHAINTLPDPDMEYDAAVIQRAMHKPNRLRTKVLRKQHPSDFDD